MIGGKVKETIIVGDKVWVDTEDKYDTCAIYVENTNKSRVISPGDSLWWQGNLAYWTPKDSNGNPLKRKDNSKIIFDIPLKRIGFSGVSKPEKYPISCSQFDASDYENTLCERCGCLEKDHIKK